MRDIDFLGSAAPGGGGTEDEDVERVNNSPQVAQKRKDSGFKCPSLQEDIAILN
jgi:hypothetical protein